MPLFRVAKPKGRRGLSAAVGLTTAFQPIPWDTSEVQGSFGSTITGGYEIDIAGLYIAVAYIEHTSGSSSQPATAQIQLNGDQAGEGWSVSGTGQRGASATALVDAGVGDELRVVGIGANVGGKQVTTSSYLYVARIGPVRWT